jgi:hypothetical protein
MKTRFESFSEFWPFYVSQHAHLFTRRLHFIGLTCAQVCVAAAVITQVWWLLIGAPLLGYGFAWYGHFRVEGNRPATFKHPFYSFLADWVMYSKMLTGQMDAEARRILADNQSGTATM